MPKLRVAQSSVEKYRDRMRKAGFRLVQLWVPDTRSRGFKRECARQSRVAAQNERVESDVMDWIEAAHDDEGWTS